MNKYKGRFILRILTAILFIIAVLWYLKEGGFEPLLAVVGGIIALITSFFVEGKPANQHTVNIEGNLMKGKRNKIQVERDGVNVSGNKMHDSDNTIKVKN
jgi:hypothetical protein